MRYLTVFAALLVLSSCHAAVQVFWPTGAEAGGGSSFYLGKVAPGHVVTIITDRGPEEDPYTGADITPDWRMSYRVSGDRMYIKFHVPEDERGAKQVCIELYGEYSRESFCPSMLVSPDLMDFHVQRNVVEGPAGEEIPIKTLVKNASAGDTAVRVSCTLEEKYCRQAEVKIRAGNMVQPEVRVVYPFPGIYRLRLVAEDLRSGETDVVEAQVVVRPTLKNSMRVLNWGLPVYFPPALPALAITSLVR